jgi:hypothetical protein
VCISRIACCGVLVWSVRLYVDFVPHFSFTMLDPTVDEFGEEEDFEDFEDNQGQATQGKPPLLVAYLNPTFIYASFSIYVYSNMHGFVIAITS